MAGTQKDQIVAGVLGKPRTNALNSYAGPSLAFGSSGAINPLLSAIITPIIAITGSITVMLYTEES